MEFNREGLEEFFTDGVLNPATTSEAYLANCSKFKELGSRVFLLYEPDPSTFAQGADFDIVLLHGIGSDEFKCWTNAQGIVWPAVFFPQDFPTARVLTVGYAHSLFNWKSDADEVTEVAAKPFAVTASVGEPSESGASSPTSAKPPEEEGGALRHIKSLADRVGQTAKASVTTYAPREVAKWWSGTGEPQHHSEASEADDLMTSTKPGDSSQLAASPDQGSSHHKKSEQVERQGTSQHSNNPLFKLLTSIRDSTGSLVAAEDEGSAANLSGSTPEANGPAESQHKKVPRDIRSLQNMRVVAAELAERLGSPEVGVGQRPVVFLVHSMGGLILKQMLISLFEAARLALPSAAALSLAAVPNSAELTAQETVVSQNFAAVQKASVLLRAVRGVVFYGTPHFGSAVASVITGLQKYYQGLGGLTPTSVVTGLGDHNKQELIRLNDRFFDVVERLGDEISAETHAPPVSAPQGKAAVKAYVNAMTASLAPKPSTWTTSFDPTDASAEKNEGSRGTVWVLSFGETKKLNGLVRVVDPESANPAPDDPRYPFYLVNADHGEVCRPLTKMSPSYAMVYGLLDRMQQRGLLKCQHEHAPSTPLLNPPSSFAPARPPSEATLSVAVEKLSEGYESGWAKLFDPAELTPQSSMSEVSAPASSSVVPSPVPSSPHVGSQRSYAAFQQGLGEVRLELPVLEEVLADLRQLLRSFFGAATPHQLDSVFVLAADVTDFVTRFYRREALIVQTMERHKAEGRADSTVWRSDVGVLIDEVVSFRVPLQILTYWVRQAADLLRVFQLSQQERAIGMNATSGASQTAAEWESNLSMHPGSRDLRELSELEQSVGLVREEWEAFRRYVSLRVRATSTPANAAHNDALQQQQQRHGATGAQDEAGKRIAGLADVSAREHIAALFFARAIRAIVSQHLHDGGALGGLLGAYLRSAILQISGSEKQLSTVHLEYNPWTPAECSGAADSGSIVSLVIEGLELSSSSPPSPVAEDSGVLTDTSGSGAYLTSNAELRAVVPALTATSSVLLGCFALFVDKLDRLDSGSGWQQAAQHFEHAKSSTQADFQVRRRLLRAASRTVRSEGLLSAPEQGNGKTTRSADREWWKTAWDLTTSKSATTDTGVMASVFANQRQAHVAKLDDGLFLSAVQLVTESFHCSILIRTYHARQVYVNQVRSSTCATAEGHAEKHTAAETVDTAAAKVEEKTAEVAADDSIGDLVRSVEAAQKVHLRTNQILRGTFAPSDTEKPFAPPGQGAGKSEVETKALLDKQPERSMKDQLRDAIQSILSELDDDEEKAGEANNAAAAAADAPAETEAGRKIGKAGAAHPSLSWTSRAPAVKKQKKPSKGVATTTSTAVSAAAKGRKNSLPMLIMNSLTKAWDAVRSGGAAPETPEHFAYTAIVMWWMVEWEAAAAIEEATKRSAISSESEKSSAHARAKLATLLDAIETAQRRRKQATGGASQSTSGAKSGAPSAQEAAPAPRVKEEEQREHQCWLSANAAIRCKWMTLRGGEEFLRRFNGELLAEHETLEQALASNSVQQLRDIQDTFVPPAALTQLDGEGGTQLAVPSSLLDAVQHDDTSAALRCWLGHCYAVHRMRSPDTAHAYLQVIRNDYAAHKKYTLTAEVGLAWSHVHNVPCSFSQLWRASRETELHSQKVASDADVLGEHRRLSSGSEVRTVASLLDFQSTGVIDTSALHNAPPAFLRFCHGAVVHHTRAVQAYVMSQGPSFLTSDTAALTHALSPVRHSAHASSMRHLAFAEEGFQRALRANPVCIGALCGLGRLRCLSVSSSLSCQDAPDASAHCVRPPSLAPPFSENGGGLARQGADKASSAEAVGFFSAALDVAAHTCLSSSSPSGATTTWPSPENCEHALDNVWLSYAAYWMSEEARRARVSRQSAAAKPHISDMSPESVEWLLKSLRFYPRNDWALTSLGFWYLQKATSPQLAPCEVSSRVTQDKTNGECDATEVSRLLGLTLLHRALAINPTNTWALWGLGTFGASGSHRVTCQRLLRGLILKNLPRL